MKVIVTHHRCQPWAIGNNPMNTPRQQAFHHRPVIVSHAFDYGMIPWNVAALAPGRPNKPAKADAMLTT